MVKNSFIKKSGQIWKINIMFIGIFIICVSLLFWFTNEEVNLDIIYFLLVSILMGSLCMLFGILRIKCPYCGVHLPQYFLKNESFNDWLNSLLNCEICPVCGANGVDPNTAARSKKGAE